MFVAAAFMVALWAARRLSRWLYAWMGIPILDVLPPFIIAFALAFLLDPVVDWLQRRGLSRALGVAIVGLSFVVVFLIVGFLLVPKIVDQARTCS